MSEGQETNSQTLVFETKEFEFDAVQQNNGVATVVKFRVLNPRVRPGDVLLVLTGADVHFHGLIGRIEEGYAIATDHRSMLPATRVH